MQIIVNKNVNDKILTRKFIVKALYDYTKPKIKHTRDKYGRDVYIEWKERVSTVTAHEYDEYETNRKVTYSGTTVCDYKDMKHYNKKYGKNVAWTYCIDSMLEAGAITYEESCMFDKIKLNATSFIIDMNKHTIKKIK